MRKLFYINFEILAFMYIQPGVPYYQPQQVYAQQVFTQPTAPVTGMPHPQTHLPTLNQSFIAPPIQTQQARPASPPRKPQPPRNPLIISDPVTGQKFDIEQLAKKNKSPEVPSSSKAPETSVPVTIRTPPPKDVADVIKFRW